MAPMNASDLHNNVNNSVNILSHNSTTTNASPTQPSYAAINDSIHSATSLIMFIAMFANAAVLLAITLNRTHRSPFRVYIINLAGANLLRVIAQSPPASLNLFASKTPWRFDTGDLCYLLLYVESVMRFGSITMHALIAVNRMWAILQPFSYRTVHSMRFAVISCLVTWTYINLSYGVYPLVERIQRQEYRLSRTCTQSATTISMTALLIGIVPGMAIPVGVVLVAFPVVVIQMLLQVRRKRQVARLPPPAKLAVEVAKEAAVRTAIGNPAEKEAFAKDIQERGKGQSKAMHDKQLFLLLLTISVAVCNAPFVFFGIIDLGFGGTVVPANVHVTWIFIITMFFQCQAVLDALLFTVMFTDLRATLWQCLTCRRLSSCLMRQQGKSVSS